MRQQTSITRARTHGIVDADPAMVSSCKYLGTVTDGSFWGGPIGARWGVPMAQSGAMAKAAELGATHVTWAEMTREPVNATGRAYLCERPGIDVVSE